MRFFHFINCFPLLQLLSLLVTNQKSTIGEVAVEEPPELLAAGARKIHLTVHNFTDFVENGPGDFQVTVSDGGKLLVPNLTAKISERLSNWTRQFTTLTLTSFKSQMADNSNPEVTQVDKVVNWTCYLSFIRNLADDLYQTKDRREFFSTLFNHTDDQASNALEKCPTFSKIGNETEFAEIVQGIQQDLTKLDILSQIPGFSEPTDKFKWINPIRDTVGAAGHELYTAKVQLHEQILNLSETFTDRFVDYLRYSVNALEDEKSNSVPFTGSTILKKLRNFRNFLRPRFISIVEAVEKSKNLQGFLVPIDQLASILQDVENLPENSLPKILKLFPNFKQNAKVILWKRNPADPHSPPVEQPSVWTAGFTRALNILDESIYSLAALTNSFVNQIARESAEQLTLRFEHCLDPLTLGHDNVSAVTVEENAAADYQFFTMMLRDKLTRELSSVEKYLGDILSYLESLEIPLNDQLDLQQIKSDVQSIRWNDRVDLFRPIGSKPSPFQVDQWNEHFDLTEKTVQEKLRVVSELVEKQTDLVELERRRDQEYQQYLYFLRIEEDRIESELEDGRREYRGRREESKIVQEIRLWAQQGAKHLSLERAREAAGTIRCPEWRKVKEFGKRGHPSSGIATMLRSNIANLCAH